MFFAEKESNEQPSDRNDSKKEMLMRTRTGWLSIWWWWECWLRSPRRAHPQPTSAAAALHTERNSAVVKTLLTVLEHPIQACNAIDIINSIGN